MINFPAELAHSLEKELRRGWNRQAVTAQIEAKQNAAINQQQHKSLDGIGRLRMRVPADAFHYWGQRLGYECWSDQQFLKEYERDNPEVKVNSGGTKLQVGYVPETKRFSKSYGVI
jgi:hypothetical protein